MQLQHLRLVSKSMPKRKPKGQPPAAGAGFAGAACSLGKLRVGCAAAYGSREKSSSMSGPFAGLVWKPWEGWFTGERWKPFGAAFAG